MRELRLGQGLLPVLGAEPVAGAGRGVAGFGLGVSGDVVVNAHIVAARTLGTDDANPLGSVLR